MKSSGFAIVIPLLLLLSACGGGGSSSPTVQAPPAKTVAAAASATPVRAAVGATPVGSTVASPVASPGSGSPAASPGSPSPVASGAQLPPLTRAQFQRQLLAAYPMEAAGRKGGTIVLGEAGDISTLNALIANDGLTLNVVGAIFEPLIGVSPVDGRPVPALADSWDVAPDGVTYTFHLNKQATWHDGADVTADDVKFSFDAILDPNTGSSYTSSVNEAVASYRVIDADTFELTAKDRLVTFYYDVPAAVLIVPKHIWEKVGFESWTFDGGSTGKDPSRVVGTGPFKFKEWSQGDHVTLTRNDRYYDVVPVIDELKLQVLPDAEAATLALQTGQTDILQIIPAAQTKTIQDTPGRKVDIYDFFQLTFYAMNLDPAKSVLFQDAKVRQALFTALDRDSITQNIFLGFGQSAVGTQPKLSPAYAPDKMTPAYAFDPVKAKALLAEAGWVDTNNDGSVDKDGKEMSFRLSYASGDATVDQIVAYMQEAWAKVGVKMEPDGADFSALLTKLQTHSFDMTLLAFNLSPDGSQGPIFTCSAYKSAFNYWRYCNQAWDQLDAAQKREFDPEKRAALLVQQSQIIWGDLPIGPIRFGVARTGYNSRIHNFHPNGYGLLWSLPYLWVDPA
ncbi:MAG: ABC transporter substrate-binding protein [Thermomicrobiales bacterium]